MEAISNVITQLNNFVWADPIIFLILLSSVYFTIRLGFVQVRNIRHQVHLLFNTSSSDAGISPFATFCTVIGYRVGIANVAGVAVGVWSGGPGAIFWMMVTSILGTAISYAECSLGQVYKIKQDGEYRGGAYYYIQNGLGWKVPALIYAVLTLVCVPILTVAPHANSITTGFQNSLGIPLWVSGLIAAVLLFVVISGGIKRIASTATYIVPVMTLGFALMTLVILVSNLREIPGMLGTIVTSAFGTNAIYGGMLGSAVLWGVKRSVNSSGAGMGEAVPAASATECAHPGVQGLVNSFSVFIDLSVCLCTGLIILVTDCFNVKSPDGTVLHIGQGSAVMADQAAQDAAGIVWAQEGVATILPSIGSILMAVFLFFFAFTTVLNYYYQGETAIAYLLRKKTPKTRRVCIWVLRFVMPLVFFFFAIQTSASSFAAGELGVGLMVWFNVIILLIMSNTVIKVYKDYRSQYKSGKEPVFNPQKLGIKNAELWMDINKDRLSETEQVQESKTS